MFTAKRSFPITQAPVEGGTSDFEITKGMLEEGVLINVPYSVNVTTAGNAVRARSLPIRRVSLLGDGKTLQVWRAVDLIEQARIFEQTPIGGLLTPASGFAIANYTNLLASVPLRFTQSRAAKGDYTAMPTWAYKNLTLRIEWGTVTDLLTGTPVGPITFTPASSSSPGPTVTQLDYADIAIPGDGKALARSLGITFARYKEIVQAAVANEAAEIDLGTTENIRALIITSELTSTGEPTDTIINKLTFKEDNTQNVYENVPWQALRAENARLFGLSMPTGVAVIDFADDGNIFNIYKATLKNNVKLVLNTAGVAGTVRAAIIGIQPPGRF